MIDFEQATRKKSKARIALTGPSGAGKTLSSLFLAYGITGDWGKIALIDTEHERGRFYAERSDYNSSTERASFRRTSARSTAIRLTVIT